MSTHVDERETKRQAFDPLEKEVLALAAVWELIDEMVN